MWEMENGFVRDPVPVPHRYRLPYSIATTIIHAFTWIKSYYLVLAIEETTLVPINQAPIYFSVHEIYFQKQERQPTRICQALLLTFNCFIRYRLL
jgi:hypothetical protein